MGADVNGETFDDMTPLMIAAREGHLEAIHMLLKNGADVNKADIISELPLHYAAEGNHTEVAKLLVRKGGDALAKTSDGETVLHLASRLDLVPFFVEQGADIHAKDDDRKTPLHIAAEKGQSDTVNYLLNNGASSTSCDLLGFSPLFYAFQNGHAAAAKMFIDRGCDKLQGDDKPSEFLEANLLQSAAVNGFVDVLHLLLDRGIHVDAVSEEGLTPLTAAAKAGQRDAVSFLLDRGANINGFDAAKISSEIGKRENSEDEKHECHCEYLRVIKKEQVRTPLYCAIAAEHREVAKLLIERGAGTLNSDYERNSLVQLAAEHGLFDVL